MYKYIYIVSYKSVLKPTWLWKTTHAFSSIISPIKNGRVSITI